MRKRSMIRAVGLSALVIATVGATSLGTAGARPSDPNGLTTVPSRAGGAVSRVPGAPIATRPNVNVTNTGGAQSETTVAVDPTNQLHILTASNDLATTTHIYESTDGGRTWAEAGLDLGGTFCYDPWLDFNLSGDAFFAYECSSGTIQRVAYRKAGETSWTKINLTNAGGFPDRDMIVTDDTPSSPFFNSVYLGYDDANANNTAYVLYSRTGFSNYLRSQAINDSSRTIGLNASVAPNGDVYAAWLDFDGKKVKVDRSEDGGATWSTDNVAHTYRLNTPQFFISIPPQPDRGIVPMVFSDVAPAGTPHAGRLYVTYTDKSVTAADTDVFVVFSDDGGETWSPEVKVNDDTVDAYQFHPSISVSPKGVVGLSFYDTRNDPNDEKTDQYIAFSPDGVSWSPNVKITTAQSDESGPGDPNDYGDYQGLDAAGRGFFQAVWTDSRPGNLAEEMYSSRVAKT